LRSEKRRGRGLRKDKGERIRDKARGRGSWSEKGRDRESKKDKSERMKAEGGNFRGRVRKDVSVARGRESEKDRDGEGPVDVDRDRGSCTLVQAVQNVQPFHSVQIVQGKDSGDLHVLIILKTSK
jgi:hypothetical protein